MTSKKFVTRVMVVIWREGRRGEEGGKAEERLGGKTDGKRKPER